jgi:hypothetical protein
MATQQDRLKAAIEQTRTRLRAFIHTRGNGSEIERAAKSFITRTFQKHIEGKARAAGPSETTQAGLFEAATRGDTQAACALLEMAIDLLDQEQKLPRGINRLVIGELQNLILSRSKKCGRKKETNFVRDWHIAGEISELRRFGYKPTRSREGKRGREQVESGSSIVAKVLSDGGLNISGVTIEGIWARLSKQYPKVFK